MIIVSTSAFYPISFYGLSALVSIILDQKFTFSVKIERSWARIGGVFPEFNARKVSEVLFTSSL